MASVAEDMTQILATLRTLEDRMKALKAMLNPEKKVRKPNPWILFNQRIDTLMKENNTPFTSMGESKKFAASLKKEKPYAEWLDQDIVDRRTDWLVNILLACPVCEENPQEDVQKHRDCIVEFATENKVHKNPVGAWMCASTFPRHNRTEVTIVNEKASASARPRGPPKPKQPAPDTDTDVSLPGAM